MRSNKYIPRLYNDGGPGRRTHSAPINVDLIKRDPSKNMVRRLAPGEPITSPIPRGERYYPAANPPVMQYYNQNDTIVTSPGNAGVVRFGEPQQVYPQNDTIVTSPGNAGVVRFGEPQQVYPQQQQQAQQQQAQQQVQQQAQQNSGPSQTRMSFNDAFKQARANGETEFPFNGKMYSTRYAEETPEQHMQSMMSAKGSAQPQVQSADPLFNDPSGSFPQNDPNLSSGFKFVPGQINPATGQPFTNQELAQSQAAAQQMNYIGDPEMLMAAMQRGEVDPSQLSRYGYKNIADLREEIRLRSERASMNETEQELKEFPGNRGFLRESEEDKLRREGIKDIDKTVSDVSSVFERGNITEGVRSLINKGLTSQRGDKLNGFKAMSEDQANRMKNRLSRRGQRDQASAAVLSILDGRMEDVEGIIEALEDSKYDVTDVDALTLIDSTSGIRIDGSQQYVEDVFSGPGFTLTVTDDFVVGIVNGKEVKIPRG